MWAWLLGLMMVSIAVGTGTAAVFTVGAFTQTASMSGGYAEPANSLWVFNASIPTSAATTYPVAITSKCTSSNPGTAASPEVTSETLMVVCLNSIASTGFASTDIVEYWWLSLPSTYTASQEWVFNYYFYSGSNSATGTFYIETPTSASEVDVNAIVAFDMTHASWSTTTVIDYELQDFSCSAVGTCPA